MRTRILLILTFFAVINISADIPFNSNPDLDYAQVQFVSINENPKNTWSFSVTIRHLDEGWNHYADLWIITDPQSGNILGERVLAHPHANEQPFTRSLSGVKLPAGQRYLEFSAKCTLHDFEGARILVDLEQQSGDNYRITMK